MPRPTNLRCQECALLPVAEARGRACWNAATCHNRRSFYLKKAQTQTQVNPQRNPSAIPVLDVPLPESPRAILYQYLAPNSKVLIHAVSAELYQGSRLVAKTKPIHTGSLTERVLRTYLQSVLEAFGTHSGTPIALFKEKVDLPLPHHRCPIPDCPLNLIS